jgi:hypothetical protein
MEAHRPEPEEHWHNRQFDNSIVNLDKYRARLNSL